MSTNDDITLYNHYKDKETERTMYKRTVIKGVDWQGQVVSSLNNKVLDVIATTMIYIFFLGDFGDKKYIGPKAWRRLAVDEKDKYFTFSQEDIIVKGICDFEITPDKTQDLKTLQNTYDDVVEITSAITCDKGSPSMQHWEVGCKQ